MYSVDFPKIIGYILCYGLGMFPGHKVKNDPPLPPFCFTASLEFKKSLIATFFTDEGHPGMASDLAPQIIIGQVKVLDDNEPPKRMIGIKLLLESMGLRPTLHLREVYHGRGGMRGVFILSINKLDDARHFYKEIGFSSGVKQKKLEKALEKTKRKMSQGEYFHIRKLKTIRSIVTAIKKLNSRGKEITSVNIARIVKKHIRSVKPLLNKLASIGIIRLKEKGTSIGYRGHSCDIFELQKPEK